MNQIFQPIEKIKSENNLSIPESRSMFEAAMELLESRHIEIPVVDRGKRVVGMISEKDLLRAMRSPLRLEEITVKQMMSPPPPSIEEGTTLWDASKMIEGTTAHRLPVVRENVLVGSVTRHDLLRVLLGVGFDVLDAA